MNALVIFLLTAAVVTVVALLLVKSRQSKKGATHAHLSDLPAIAQLLGSRASEGDFVALGSHGVPEMNVQLSYEGGLVGFDWVLLAQVNKENRGRVEALAAERGQRLAEQTQNGVSYLRTTSGDVPGLCRAVLEELFRVEPEEPLWVEAGGVEWPGSST